jgi:hypothetical protein
MVLLSGLLILSFGSISRIKNPLILINRIIFVKDFPRNLTKVCFVWRHGIFFLYKQIKNVCVIHFLNVYFNNKQTKNQNGNINIKDTRVVRFNWQRLRLNSKLERVKINQRKTTIYLYPPPNKRNNETKVQNTSLMLINCVISTGKPELKPLDRKHWRIIKCQHTVFRLERSGKTPNG